MGAARPASATTAADICPVSANPCYVAHADAVTPGSTLDFGSRTVDVTPYGQLTVTGGELTILAGSVRLETGSVVRGVTSNGIAATIRITSSGDIRIDTGYYNRAQINVNDTE